MSGAIAFASAAAASGSSSTIVAGSLTANDLAGGTASAGITYKPNGSYETVSGATTFPEGNWVSPVSAASEWEIRATVASGATPTTGAIGSWLALSSTRGWTLVRSSTGLIESTLTFEFRRAAVGGAAEFTVTNNILTAEVI